MKRAWIVAGKDLRLYLRDRTALLLGLLLPIVLSTIFATAMGSMGDDDAPRKVKIYVQDLDRSGLSQMLVAKLQERPALDVRITDDARRQVARGNGAAALLIPSGYADDLNSDRKPGLKLYRDASKLIEQQIVAGNLIPVLARMAIPSAARSFMGAFGGSGSESAPTRALGDDAEVPLRSDGSGARDGAGSADDAFGAEAQHALGLEFEEVSGGGSSSQKQAMQSHAVSGTAVMMLLFGLVASGGTLLEEQASGTLERLRLLSGSPSPILWGKFLSTCAIGIAQLGVLFAYAVVVFGLPVFQEPLALFVHSMCVVWAATGLGLLLAVVCRTRKQLEGLSTLLILMMSALGGSWFPLFITPDWFQWLGHFTINAWAMDGYQGVLWYGKGLSGIVREDLVLLGIGAVMSLLTLQLWKRRFRTG